jgi:ATP-dependent DNA helicase RecG
MKVSDLLWHLPRRYEDRRSLKTLDRLEPGRFETARGHIRLVDRRRLRGFRSLVEVTLEDGRGKLKACWFNQPYLAKTFRKGDELFLSGMVTHDHGLRMIAPEFEMITGRAESGELIHSDRIVPIYPATEGLSQKILRGIVYRTLRDHLDGFADIVPPKYGRRRDLMALGDALQNIHFPESMARAEAARRSLVYREFFLLEAAMALRRFSNQRIRRAHSLAIGKAMDSRIRSCFPFQLTTGQDRAISEIRADLASSIPMNRLLQGDVGSGKTVVAVYALLAAVENGYQAVLMAPTEVLAEQHYLLLRDWLPGDRVKVRLLRGGLSGARRREALHPIRDGEVQITVGTHALLEPDVSFARLALVVVDEQHKFGVLQRARLHSKGWNPHVLVMTATPIPRSLALTVYSDLDLSTLMELPPGRRPIKTLRVPPKKEAAAFAFIRERLEAGEQCFIVCPTIEGSEELGLDGVLQTYERLKNGIYRNFPIGLLHGRLHTEEKEEVMGEFKAGRTRLLVATTVVEVGLDVPAATLMVVRDAHRFGLAQLHQLRGRVGRGERPSYCLLMGTPPGDDARRRLAVLERSADGFEIAEEDLRIRGPGEFFGIRQCGLPALRVADLQADYSQLIEARDDAFELITEDPELQREESHLLLLEIGRAFEGRLDLIGVG